MSVRKLVLLCVVAGVVGLMIAGSSSAFVDDPNDPNDCPPRVLCNGSGSSTTATVSEETQKKVEEVKAAGEQFKKDSEEGYKKTLDALAKCCKS